MYIFRTTAFLLLVNCICVFSSSKPRPLKVYVCHWSFNAFPIVYLKGDTTAPLYRLEKEPADGSTLLVDEQKEIVIGRTTGLSFRIFDAKTQTWMIGRIENHNKLFGDKLSIVWNGMKMTMTGRKTHTFWDQNNKMLARRVPYSGKNKYDLEIWSDRLPETVYILVLASNNMLGG